MINHVTKGNSIMKRIVIIVGIVAVLGVGIWWTVDVRRTTDTSNSNQNVNAEVVTPTVTYQGVDGKNALELLKASHTVVDDSGFVTSIDGQPNAAPKYWTLYMNGTMASVGAKDLVTKATDTITWKLEAFTE